MSALTLQAAELYAIQLAHLSDDMLSVSLTATTVDEDKSQLLKQEIVSERVTSLARIKQSSITTSCT